jgi:alkylhydroperoxidase family enzyme
MILERASGAPVGALDLWMGGECEVRAQLHAAAGEADLIDEEFYAQVGNSNWDGFSEREVLAAEFAERFALDHLSMDDPFWVRLRSAFTDSEIVDLGLCVGMWVSQGRLNQILDVDGGCRVPSPDAPLTGG